MLGRRGRPFNRTRGRGQSAVEFALAAPVLFLLICGLADGAWFVLETSAVSNAASQAVRWEIAVQNWDASVLQPYCEDSTPNVPSTMIQAAEAGAGPFAGAVGTTSPSYAITNSVVTDPTTGAVIGCRVTVTVPFTPLTSVVHIGPSTISSTVTANLT